MSISVEALGISKEDILQLAATKLADDAASEEYVGDRVDRIIRDRVEKAVGKQLEAKIDALLAAEMEKILGEEIVPVNIWGEREGEPTTLRAALAKRAKDFWQTRVDKDGRPSSYGGAPRHEHLMQKVLNDEFSKAVRENASTVVAAFKEAVKADLSKLAAEHIEKLIPSRR